jgi:hypothetical protein
LGFPHGAEMPEQAGKQTPPYIPFATFDNFINGLGESGVPDKIDSSLMRSFSGSTRSGLLVTLRYLKLIDENDNTLASLEKLAKSKNDDRATLLRTILVDAYGFLTRVDISRATPAQLAEAIGEEGAGGGTRDKAVNFFLKAAEAAGMPISPHILKGKHARSATPMRRAKRQVSKPTKAKVQRDPPAHNDNDNSAATKKLSEQVLAILDQEELADDVEQSVWILLKYLRKEGL